MIIVIISILSLVLPSGFTCAQAREHFDAINRPVRHFLDAGAHTRDVEQQESKGQSVKGSAISMVLNRWKTNRKIEQIGDAKYKKL